MDALGIQPPIARNRCNDMTFGANSSDSHWDSDPITIREGDEVIGQWLSHRHPVQRFDYAQHSPVRGKASSPMGVKSGSIEL